ncbi:hypothetical protein ACGF12_13755 [Kitasatospora sp. NPDC048296]|uniref:hypothetical protein n=1 Tax=Kitasatospora sp. NPDC048296 TaxID=3364048 RepID=UPI003721EC63
MTTTILRAAELARILEQTAPHRSEPTSWKPGALTLLDADATRLHAVTTCRYTLAVGSAPACGPEGGDGEPWAATIQGHDADSLAAWARLRGHDEDVHLIVAADRVEAFTPTSALRVPVSTAAFPLSGGWRPFLAARLKPATGDAPRPIALDTAILHRWRKAGDYVWLGVAEHDGSLLVLGEDFAGVQMPVALEWQPPLAHISAADGRPVEALPLPDGNDEFAHLRAEMLQRVVTSGEALKDAAYSGGPDAVAPIANAAGSAYLAFRALRALEEVDPRRAHRLAAEVTDELDFAEFTEAAFDAAHEIGLDPSAWVARYNAAQAAQQA